MWSQLSRRNNASWILYPLRKIPGRAPLLKNCKSQCDQLCPRSTVKRVKGVQFLGSETLWCPKLNIDSMLYPFSAPSDSTTCMCHGAHILSRERWAVVHLSRSVFGLNFCQPFFPSLRHACRKSCPNHSPARSDGRAVGHVREPTIHNLVSNLLYTEV